MKGKRAEGPLNMLVSGAIIVLIAIITISIGISVNENVKDSLKGTPIGIVNETTGTLSNVTPTNLNFIDVIAVSGLWVLNDSGAPPNLVNANNYTIGHASGTITLVYAGGFDYEGNTSYINYTYYPHGADYNASARGTTGLAAFADYWVSIVAILILVVIVGLFAYFRGGVGGVEIR